MLEAIAKVAEPQGFVAAKKPDQKTVDALLKHKLVKKGKKDDKTKNFFVMISLAGKKFLGTKPAAAGREGLTARLRPHPGCPRPAMTARRW